MRLQAIRQRAIMKGLPEVNFMGDRYIGKIERIGRLFGEEKVDWGND
jgi:hypothetical protein